MNAYPVVFDVERPATMSRAHVFLRLLLAVLLACATGASGGLGLLYLGIPVVAAIFIARMGGERYVAEGAERASRWLEIAVGFLAFMALLTDEFPGSGTSVRFRAEGSGCPTVSSALLRIVRAIPSALTLGLLSIVSGVVGLIASLSILLLGRYPQGCWRFQLGFVRWEARLLAYMASIIDPYPPFSFDTEPTH
jgi:hypothetical protein